MEIWFECAALTPKVMGCLRLVEYNIKVDFYCLKTAWIEWPEFGLKIVLNLQKTTSPEPLGLQKWAAVYFRVTSEDDINVQAVPFFVRHVGLGAYSSSILLYNFVRLSNLFKNFVEFISTKCFKLRDKLFCWKPMIILRKRRNKEREREGSREKD